MKNLIVVIMIVLLSSCAASKKVGNKNFQLIKANKQAYILGINLNNGKTSGITHSMYFNTIGDIQVEKLWLEGVNIDFEEVSTGENSIRIRATFYNGTKSNIHEDLKAPIEYTGKALIQYKDQGEIKYFIVTEFQEFKKIEEAR